MQVQGREELSYPDHVRMRFLEFGYPSLAPRLLLLSHSSLVPRGFPPLHLV